MSLPRSTLLMGILTLLSTSTTTYLFLNPRVVTITAPEPEEIPPTLAKPGDLNPIAAKVIADGGPRTPVVAGKGGPRRGNSELTLGTDPRACLEQGVQAALRNMNGTPIEKVPCPQGTGPELKLNLSVTPLPGASPKDPPTHTSCTATLRGSQAITTPPVESLLGEPCVGVAGLLLEALEKSKAPKPKSP